MCKRGNRVVPLLTLLWITIGGATQAGDLKDSYPSFTTEAQTNVRVFVHGSSFSAPGQLTSTFNSAAAPSQFSTEIADQFNYYPVGSTVAALTYKLDSEMNIVERSTDGLRPLLAEPGRTAGAGKLNVALGYSWMDYDQLQGRPLNDYNLTWSGGRVMALTATAEDVISGPTPWEKSGSFRHSWPRFPAADGPGVQRNGGIPVHWDPGDLHARCGDLKRRARGTCGALPRYLAQRERPGGGSHRLGDWANVRTSDGAQSSGIGDLILRTKTSFFDGDYGALASRLEFYVPTGDADNLRGLGRPAARASLIYSATLGNFSPHASAGLMWRFGAERFNFMHFALGGNVRVTPWLTLTTDVLLDRNISQYSVGNTILSVATGIKVNPWRRVLLSTNLRWRPNDQGLHALVIPSVAIEYTFR
jgi:hypothetical protein